MAWSTRMAFTKESRETISRGFMPLFTSSTTRRPLSRAILDLAALVAWAVAQPVSDRPMASVMHAMVLAV